MTTPDGASRHHVVVVGGGFGGLEAVRHLGLAPVDVTLIDRRSFHLFQPLVYQVATGVHDLQARPQRAGSSRGGAGLRPARARSRTTRSSSPPGPIPRTWATRTGATLRPTSSRSS